MGFQPSVHFSFQWFQFSVVIQFFFFFPPCRRCLFNNIFSSFDAAPSASCFASVKLAISVAAGSVPAYFLCGIQQPHRSVSCYLNSSRSKTTTKRSKDRKNVFFHRERPKTTQTQQNPSIQDFTKLNPSPPPRGWGVGLGISRDKTLGPGFFA